MKYKTYRLKGKNIKSLSVKSVQSVAHFLLSKTGREAAAAVTGQADDTLAAGMLLRQTFPGIDPSLLSSVIELVLLREKARGKFTRAEHMFFTREALEQATDTVVSNHRAKRFSGLKRVCDGCCGIGGDAIALGKAAGHITCIDKDAERLAYCGENLRVHGIEGFSLIEGDVLTMKELTGEYDALFLDPSRRTGGRRTRNLDAMEPPISDVENLLRLVKRGAVKLPPAADNTSLTVPNELEWVSTADGLKEAVAWTGDFRRCSVSVTALHKGAVLCDTVLPDIEPDIAKAGAYLYEPDPALIRSGLLGRKAAALGMKLLHDEVAYMTADNRIDDPFFSVFRIIRRMAFNLKKLSQELNKMDIGTLTVKKRCFPMLPEEVISKLNLKGSQAATVILTKEMGRNAAFIVEKC